MLEENYNPRAKKALWQMANTLAGEHELLNTYFEEIWESSEIECRKGQIHLKLNFLIAQPVAIQRLIVRRVVTTLNPNITDIDYQVTEKAVRFINDSSNPRSHNFDLCNDIHMVLENETLVVFYRERYISNLWPQLVGSGSIIYPIPGELYLQLKMENNETKTSAWRFISEWVEGSPKVLSEAKNNSDLYQAWLDLGGKENISSEMKFEIRMRRIGDKFRPLGLNGHSMKLSDFMVNIKLPNHARSGWPLICLNGEVIWIPGYRISHNYRITPATQLALRICLQRVGQVDLLGD